MIHLQPTDFELETTTIWSFPNRGHWATHSGNYRGNWSPYVPRNLILRYSRTGDWILDQFMGSGTTLIEAKLLNRNAIGVDINPQAIAISKQNLNFKCEMDSKIYIKQADATKLVFLKDDKIDFICTHPPYANIIKYSKELDGDISLIELEEFLQKIREVAKEAYRVLKKGKMCAIMMGDIRKYGRVIPLGFQVMQCFLDVGFINQEIIIKQQHHCKSTNYWKNQKKDFLLLAHEYILIFQK